MRNKDTTNARIAYMKMCETRLKLYNKSPKLCLYCGKPILYEKKIMGNKFCNKSCAAKYNNKLYKKEKVMEKIDMESMENLQQLIHVNFVKIK